VALALTSGWAHCQQAGGRGEPALVPQLVSLPCLLSQLQDWEEGDGDYVAPELLQNGGEPSPACDVFSLGATLFECATGKQGANCQACCCWQQPNR
jgi:serine/threonine protein kinase